jgi:hypothetical protein
MDSLGERLKSYWDTAGIKVRGGTSQQAIISFELKYGVCLTQDLRDYHSIVDGMEDGESDDSMLSFLPLSFIKNVMEDLIEFGGIPDYRKLKKRLPQPHGYFVFADFLIRSQVYAIRLSPNRSDATPVIWICGEHWRTIASSFSDFAEKYLTGNGAILL